MRALTRQPFRASVLVLVWLAVACGDAGDPGPDPPGSSIDVALSPPLDAAGPAGLTAVLVSAIPGSTSGAASATVRNTRSGERLEVAALDGGFDPVPLDASLGDEVSVTLRDAAGGEASATVLVARAPRPRLVRTSPRARQTDVPLNTVVEVVFSAPVHEASAEAAIRVERGGAFVPGTVRVTGESRAHVLFEADQPLAPNAEYQLLVGLELRDMAGGTLAESASIPFTTGALVGGVDSLELGVRYGTTFGLTVGDSLGLAAYAWGAGLLTMRNDVTWESSDEGVLRLEPVQPRAGNEFLMGLRAVGAGRAVVRASAAGVADSLVLSVSAMPSAPTGRLLLGTDDGIWAVDVGGANPVKLGDGRWPTVSNDGRLAYVIDGNRRLMLRETDGTLRTLLDEPQSYFTCPHLLPDGEHVLVTQLWEEAELRRWELLLVSTATASSRVLTSTDWYSNGNQPFDVWGADEACAFVSPDGLRVAYVELPTQGWSTTWSMNLEGGDARQIIAGYWPGPWSPDGSLLLASRVDPTNPEIRPPTALVRTSDGAITGGDADWRYPGAHAWSPDGQGFVYAQFTRGVMYRSLAGGSLVLNVATVPTVISAGFIPPSAWAALGAP